MKTRKTEPNVIELKQSLSTADIRISKLTQQLEEVRNDNRKLRNKLNPNNPSSVERNSKIIAEKDNHIQTLNSVIDSKNSFINSTKQHMARILPLAQAYMDMFTKYGIEESDSIKIQQLQEALKHITPLAQIQMDYMASNLTPKKRAQTPKEPLIVDSPTVNAPPKNETPKVIQPTLEIAPKPVKEEPPMIPVIHHKTHGIYDAFSEDCSALVPLLGQKITIKAKFKRFSTVTLYNGKHIPCLLLHDVKQTNGQPLKDHSWVLSGKTLLSLNLKENDWLETTVTVKEYTRKDDSKAIGFIHPTHARKI